MKSYPRHVISTVIFALLIESAANAADDSYSDIRLEVGILPGIKTVKGVNGTTDTSTKTEGNAQLAYQHGCYMEGIQWGWVAGAGIFYDLQKGTFQGTDIKSNAYGVFVDTGVAYRINNMFHLELTPFYGMGGDKLKANSASGHGVFLKYGAILAGFYDWNEITQAGIDVGWEGFQGKAKADYAGVGSNQDVTYRGNGILAGIEIGYRF